MLLTGVVLYGQGQPSLKGKVICKNDNKPVDMAAVVIKELNIWSMTDENGNYALKNVPNGKYTIVVSCLGFVQYEQEVTFPYTGSLDLTIEQSTLALDEVVVVAQEGKRMGSESVISQSAIQHVQPTDLSDVMQLLPGQLATNPDLSGPKQLSIREISASGDNLASLGTALIIDGAPVSNDANLQFNSTSTASTTTGVTAGFATTASGGVDVRQIAVDNIESVEVVRGIGSVETGDMLSGAVKVTLKKGKTPFTAKIKIDPGLKQFYTGKGFDLGKKFGTLNTDFDYTRSLDDIRTKYKSYNRLTGGLSWSNTIMRDSKPMTLNLTLRGTHSLDLNESDPEMLAVQLYESNDNSISFNFNTKWALNSKFLTNLDFMVSGNIQHQKGHEVDFESISTGSMPQPISLVAGEFEAPILPSTYISDLTIDGRPYYFDTKLSGNKSFYIGKALNNINGGLEYHILGNNGEGRVYDLSRPPSPTSSSDSRPRSYKDIPSLDQYSAYLEENIKIPVSKMKLDIQGGLRFTNVQPEGLFTSKENIFMFDPRTNVKLTLVDKKEAFIQKLAIRGGYGLFSKAPSLLYLYPDKSYYDKVCFNYYDASTYDALIVVKTNLIEDTRNTELKPTVNQKFEGGLDIKIRDIDMSITLFSEKMENGFSFDRFYTTMVYNNYDNLSILGANPYYVEGDGIYYTDPATSDIVKVGSEQDTVFISYSYPSNNDQTIKKGIEFTIDFGTLQALRTSFVLDGAYMKVTKQKMNDFLTKPSSGTLVNGKEYPYIAVYPGGDGDVKKRLSTNLRAITHIKELRMIITTSLQVVWYYAYHDIYDDADGNPIPYTLDGSDIYTNLVATKYVDPIGYYDHAMVYHTFDRSLATSRPYSDLIQSKSQTPYLTRTYPPYYQINLKLTKEITDLVNLSFYANNITNHKPYIKVRGVPETYANPNSSLYFGAELKLKF